MVPGVRVRSQATTTTTTIKPDDLNNNKSKRAPPVGPFLQLTPPNSQTESSESEAESTGSLSHTGSSTNRPGRRSSKPRFVIEDNDDEVDYHREQRIGESLVNDAASDTAMSEAYLKGTKGQVFEAAIVWRNVFTMILLHGLGIYGWWYCIRHARWQTFAFAYSVGSMSGIGILAGAHRLWTHRSYKAHWSVRTLLMILQTLALQVGQFF